MNNPPTMGILARYVVTEFLKVLVASLLALSLVVTLGLGLKEGLRQGLPPGVILETLWYIFPETLGIAMPAAVLLAACTVYSRMGGTNELQAVKALGIHPLRLVTPVVGLAVLLSLFTVCVYEVAAVWGRPGAQQVVFEEIEAIAYSVLRTHRGFSARGLAIAVKQVEGRSLVGPTITFRDPKTDQHMTLAAEEAEIRSSDGTLTFRCHHGELEANGKVRLAFSGPQEYTLVLQPPERPLHRDWVACREIPSAIAALRAKAEQIERQLAGKARFDLESLHAQQTRLADVRWQIDRLRTEPYRRWANGFSCLGFVLVGAPVAMRLRQQHFLTCFFVCFLPILAFYYPLLMLQEDLTCSGRWPPWGFWLADAAVVLAGCCLFPRVVRH